MAKYLNDSGLSHLWEKIQDSIQQSSGGSSSDIPEIFKGLTYFDADNTDERDWNESAAISQFVPTKIQNIPKDTYGYMRMYYKWLPWNTPFSLSNHTPSARAWDYSSSTYKVDSSVYPLVFYKLKHQLHSDFDPIRSANNSVNNIYFYTLTIYNSDNGDAYTLNFRFYKNRSTEQWDDSVTQILSDGWCKSTSPWYVNGKTNNSLTFYHPGDTSKTFYEYTPGTGIDISNGVISATGGAGQGGITPEVTVTSITGGHNVAFSYGENDERNTDFDVMDGAQGIQGITPTVNITNVTNGKNIEFYYGENDARNTNVNIYNGTDAPVYTAGTGISIVNGQISLSLANGEAVSY